jgi:hypothetical protein
MDKRRITNFSNLLADKVLINDGREFGYKTTSAVKMKRELFQNFFLYYMYQNVLGKFI